MYAALTKAPVAIVRADRGGVSGGDGTGQRDCVREETVTVRALLGSAITVAAIVYLVVSR